MNAVKFYLIKNQIIVNVLQKVLQEFSGENKIYLKLVYLNSCFVNG